MRQTYGERERWRKSEGAESFIVFENGMHGACLSEYAFLGTGECCMTTRVQLIIYPATVLTNAYPSTISLHPAGSQALSKLSVKIRPRPSL